MLLILENSQSNYLSPFFIACERFFGNQLQTINMSGFVMSPLFRVCPYVTRSTLHL